MSPIEISDSSIVNLSAYWAITETTLPNLPWMANCLIALTMNFRWWGEILDPMQREHRLHRVMNNFFIVSSVKMNYNYTPSKMTTLRSYKVPKSVIFCLFLSAFFSFVVLVSILTCSCCYLFFFLRLYLSLVVLSLVWVLGLECVSGVLVFKSMFLRLMHSLRQTLSDSSTCRSLVPSSLIGLS